ncbi:hypothetical protein OEA41_008598 [Lepraria neglecta]|uniref:Flavin-nucleotide-binding protein n=1 Tax=Lepraria neglecta TaxID=209136 RepID=A0AAD9Z108_9LECA|nr:hypothetical protein OEA41_008598 [Lepraria neglecta]
MAMSTKNAYNAVMRNSVRRARQRAAYDYKTVHSVFNAASIYHVAFLPADPQDDPFPTILPMLGTMCSFSNPTGDLANTPLDIYLHGHAASRLMKLPKDHPDGLPICVSAAILDGIVLALAPFHNSCNYRSAVAHGYAVPVTDEKERLFAMTRITDSLVPGRWDNSRNPPTKGEDRSTGILKVTVETASAKTRVGGPSDDKKDLKDPEVAGSIWTGVVPAWETLGAPQASSENKVIDLPTYLGDWRKSTNHGREQYANAAVNLEK